MEINRKPVKDMEQGGALKFPTLSYTIILNSRQ